ncbi:hypothetical protein PFISCL1PPCAC_13313, partial [Pristionchus fissidentatus]
MIRVAYAYFVNDQCIHTHRPLFEVVSGTEVLMLSLVAFLCPLNAWIAFRAVPLHRNIRYALVICIMQGGAGTCSRILLLVAQHFECIR